MSIVAHEFLAPIMVKGFVAINILHYYIFISLDRAVSLTSEQTRLWGATFAHVVERYIYLH
jgi:hypothetical protein